MRKKEKKNAKIGDDDEMPIRAQIRDVSEGKTVTIVMAMVTIFALVGAEAK
jgi:hypothetical protein